MREMMLCGWLLTLGAWGLTRTVAASAADRPDILIADFEGKDYGSWKATGAAFGPGPARGTLPNQMAVSGFEGKGLVNSYYRGDDTTGTLTSPSFKIERKFINFLIGGGRYPGKACINLLVEGKIVRTATGPNDRPGGTERLEWHSWDVSDLNGKSAVIEVVDQQKGGWGHINVDHIVMADRKKSLEPARREIAVASRYLHFPVNNGASMRTVRLSADGRLVREFEIELAEGNVDLWAFTDVSAFRGRRLTIEGQLTAGSRALEAVTQGDAIKDTDNLYREKHRPQFHFTPLRGWTNDPNGLVYYKGEYHLFFQHNPFGTKWGNMTWGHAVSPDLVHWTELGDAIHPDRLGTIFSGSAVVDHNNTAGFKTGDESPIVCIYTSAGGTLAWSKDQPFTQSLAYSNDRGRSWTVYAGNPVLKHIVGSNRDPKVVWHEPTKRWIMALFLDKNDYGLFASLNLKDWTQLQTITMPDCGECPDFFPMPVDGDPKNVKWVFTAANGRYFVGDFDGKKFVPSGSARDANWGGWYYAVQSFSDIPASDGRRIQVAWMNGGNYPGMPFNQQMNFPCEMTLRSLPEGLRICRNPVREIESLRTKTHTTDALQVNAELLDIEIEFEPRQAPGQSAEFGIDLRGERLLYSAKNRTLSFLGKSAPVDLIDGRVRLRILVDRTSVEVFANDGRVPMSFCWLPKPEPRRLGLFVGGGVTKIVSLRVHELKSAWQR